MARRDVSGIFLLDKPEGISSSYALIKVRGIYRAQKGGHTGALDPLASGLLPVCLGEAAKFSSFFLEGRKRYEVTGKLGFVSTTFDREGEITPSGDITGCQERLPEACRHFTGVIKQLPPVHSAVKVAGKPLYKYARSGKEVTIPEREVEIFELKLLSSTEDTFTAEVYCSKGTYIRSLVSDIGEYLGCGAYVTALRRIGVDGLPTGKMISLEKLQQIADARENREDFTELDKLLWPLELAVVNLPQVTLPDFMAEPFTHGVRQGPDFTGAQLPEPMPADNEPVRVLDKNGKFLGVGVFEHGLLKARRLMSV